MQPGLLLSRAKGVALSLLNAADVAPHPKAILVVGRMLSRLRAAVPPNPGTRNPACAQMLAGWNLNCSSVGPGLEAIFLHLAIKRRATDVEPLGDFGHVTAVAAERQADHVGFDGFERADFAVFGDGLNAERAA